MKALIVDDEKHVRDAIRLLVDWQRYRIDELYEASEGEAAIRVIKERKPEIVFTDMRMPVKDGVELLRWIHHHSPECKTIVISGHDDFDYVRNTVKYGGVDYILKPIDEEELNESLAKAVESWRRDAEARRKQQMLHIGFNQIKPVYWDKTFSALVQGEAVPNDFASEFLKEFGLAHLPETAQIALVSLESIPKFIKRKFTSDLDLLFFTLANIAREYLQQGSLGYAFRYWNSPHELVIVFWGEQNRLANRMLDLNEGIFRTLGARLEIGIGTRKKFLGGLLESYQEAQNALKQRNLLQAVGRIHQYGASDNASVPALSFDKYEAHFRAALISAQESEIKAAAAQWIADMRALPHISVEQLAAWNHEYSVFKSRLYNEFLQSGSSDSRIDLATESKLLIPLDEHGKFSFKMLKEELTQDLLKLSDALSRVRKREHHIIYEIVDYIERHYSEDITLQHISERFYLSREYISRKFKQEMKENISDYLTRIRIDQAKLLLRNPQLKIHEVAEMVGYRDEKYFSKVFKKMTDCSPNQYRRRQ